MPKIMRFWFFILLTALGWCATLHLADKATQGTWYAGDLCLVAAFGCCAAVCLVMAVQQAIRVPEMPCRASNASPEFLADKAMQSKVTWRRVAAGSIDLVTLLCLFPLSEMALTAWPPTPRHGFNEASFPFVAMFLYFLITQVVLPMRWRKTFGMLFFNIRFYRSAEVTIEAKHFWYRAILLIPAFWAVMLIASLPLSQLWLKRPPLTFINWPNDVAHLSIDM